MAIVKMKHLQVLALERDHDAILRRLQHMGCLEISEPDVQALPDTLRRCDTAAADLLARQRQLQSAIDILRAGISGRGGAGIGAGNGPAHQ